MAGGFAGGFDSVERNKDFKIDIRPSSRIWCKTAFNEEYEGEVMAYDHELLVLVIKTVANNPSGKSAKKSHDVHVINLKHIPETNFEIRALAQKESPLPLDIDRDKIDKRLRLALEEKTKAVERIGIGVTLEAQMLFDHLSTLYRDCRWQDNTIVLMDDVRISPPYGPENCTGHGQDSLDRIRKMITKFHRDKQRSKEIKEAS